MSLDTISAPIPPESEWHDTPPPRRTWIWMRTQANSGGMLVKTCARGCCAYCPGLGNMMLSELWKAATVEEIIKVEAEVAAIKPMSQEELWDLFI